MAQGGTYGTVAAEHGGLGHFEPVLIIRASDPQAPLMVRMHAMLAQSAGADPVTVEMLMDRAGEFEDYQRRCGITVPRWVP